MDPRAQTQRSKPYFAPSSELISSGISVNVIVMFEALETQERSIYAEFQVPSHENVTTRALGLADCLFSWAQGQFGESDRFPNNIGAC